VSAVPAKLLQTTQTSMRIADIWIGQRHRVDMGDIEALARSIEEIGLLHPVVVTTEGQLIAGARRIAAYRFLEASAIPVRVMDLDEILRGEQDENNLHKHFTPSEKVAIARALDDRAREQARERQGTRTDLGHSENFTEGSRGDVRDIVGRAVGMSGPIYQRARAVVKAAEEDPETYGPLVEEMDRTGKVSGVYERVAAMRKRKAAPPPPTGKSRAAVAARHERIRQMAAEGYREESIAEAVGVTPSAVSAICRQLGLEPFSKRLGKSKRVDPNHVMESIISYSTPTPESLAVLDWGAMDRGRFDAWDKGLSEAIGTLTRLRNRLRRERDGSR